MGEIASAHVSIYPKFASNFGSSVKAQVGAAGTAGGTAFSTGFGKATGGMKSAMAGIKAGIIGIIASATVGAVVEGFNDLTDAASDLNETVNKSKSVFGPAFGEMDKWSRKAATGLGLSRAEALGAAAGFGDMFTQLGASSREAAGMSKKVMQLSADLGSYNNLPTADVSERIAAAFRGEYDSLQKVIPNINAARVEKEALAMTGKKNAKALTAEEKAQAVLAIVTKDGAKAQGDFAKTSGDVANKAKIVAARTADLKAKFGTLLIPMKKAALDGFGKLVTAGEKFTTWLKKNPRVVEGFNAAMSLLGDIFGGVAKVIGAILLPVLAVLTEAFANGMEAVAGLLDAMSNLPGMEGLADSAEKVRKVAAGAHDAADGLKDLADEAWGAEGAESALNEELTKTIGRAGLTSAEAKALAEKFQTLTNKASGSKSAMKDARDAFVKAATGMGLTKTEALELWRALRKVDGKYEAEVKADTTKPKAAADRLRNSLVLVDGPYVAKVTTPGATGAKSQVDHLYGSLKKIPGSNWKAYVKADTSSGQKTVDNFISRNNGRVINIRGIVNGGGGWADGGPVFPLRFDAGGRVPGWSPHDRADNIDARLTAGEFVQPVAAVDHYGFAAMEAVRRRQATISFADGGMVPGSQAAKGITADDLRRALSGLQIRLTGTRRLADDMAGVFVLAAERGV